MQPLPTHYRRLLGLLAIASLLVDAGCAGLRCPLNCPLRCPRIDPTGERCLIWPKDEAALATVPPPATVFPAATATLPALAGNPTAPPVLTDPVFPAPEAPAVPAATGVPVTPVSTQGVALTTPQDRLTLSPERILAPVGSEVVLKANICTTEGYTLAEQKVEWMLAREGVGEFGEVSGKGAFHPPIYPWNRGSKTDNYLATSYTANGPHCINRGTPDPSDDVNILRGDAWVTVTSPREGTSSVTAFTQAVESWPLRKQVATIYWVDVQWTFPPAAVTSGGRETLTTVATRQTDGTPLAGWIVRYEVADGNGAGGAAATDVQEVMTDANGQASVQVSPTAAGAASSKIDMQLIRPANFGGNESPRLVIGSSSTIVNWSGGSTYVPSTSSPLTPVTPVTPSIPTIPTTPPTTTSPPITTNPVTPPPTTPVTPAGPARLEVSVQAAETAEVGGTLRSVITIRNTGQSPANNVVLTNAFDLGLIFPTTPSSNKIENPRVGTISPGETRTIPIDFQVTKSGSLCQVVEVKWDGGGPESVRKCTVVAEAAPQRNASFRVAIDAPVSGIQNEQVAVDVHVLNTGEVPLTNLQIIEKYPLAAMVPQPTELGVQVINGAITRTIERLEPGAKKTFRVNCVLKAATRATIFVDGTAGTDASGGGRIANSTEKEIEIKPASGAAIPGGAVAPPADQPLRIGIQLGTTPMREGELPTIRTGTRTNCQITVRNPTNAAQTNLAIRVFFSDQMTPDVNMLAGPPGTTGSLVATQDGRPAVEFTAVPMINAGEALIFTIPVNAKTPGQGNVAVQALSSAATAPNGVVGQSQNVTIIGNRL